MSQLFFPRLALHSGSSIQCLRTRGQPRSTTVSHGGIGRIEPRHHLVDPNTHDRGCTCTQYKISICKSGHVNVALQPVARREYAIQGCPTQAPRASTKPVLPWLGSPEVCGRLASHQSAESAYDEMAPRTGETAGYGVFL